MKTKINQDRLMGLDLKTAAEAAYSIEDRAQHVSAKLGREAAIMALALELRLHCRFGGVSVGRALEASANLLRTPRQLLPQQLEVIAAHLDESMEAGT